MTSRAENLFDEYMEGGPSPLRLKPELMLVIAAYLEDAISSSSQKDIAQLSASLMTVLNESMRRAPSSAAAAARNIPAVSETDRASYLLGQVSFAQMIASQLSNSRASDAFMRTMYHRAYSRYVVALYRNDMNNTQLHNLIGERPETVSRKFKMLRALGVADFRREGNTIVNFLTPLARQAFDATKVATKISDVESELKIDMLSRYTGKLKGHMKESLTFAPSPMELA